MSGPIRRMKMRLDDSGDKGFMYDSEKGDILIISDDDSDSDSDFDSTETKSASPTNLTETKSQETFELSDDEKFAMCFAIIVSCVFPSTEWVS